MVRQNPCAVACTGPAIVQTNVSRPTPPPCKPRGVVIVQGFEGVFAKSSPQLLPICGRPAFNGTEGLGKRRAGIRILQSSAPLKRDEIGLNGHRALALCLSMTFSENRFTLFRIML
jgi:hypothetical protein